VQGFLEVSHSCLPGILIGNFSQDCRGILDFILGQAMLFHRFGDQVLPADGKLLVTGVPRELNDLHSIQQRPGDGIQCICRTDKQHLAHIEGDIQIGVAEG